MVRERAAWTIILVAVAFFYPVFAVEGSSRHDFYIHAAIFVAFAALAVAGYKRSSGLIAVGLIAHGVFDFFALGWNTGQPDWWPIFCGVVDIVLAVGLLFAARGLGDPTIEGRRL